MGSEKSSLTSWLFSIINANESYRHFEVPNFTESSYVNSKIITLIYLVSRRSIKC